MVHRPLLLVALGLLALAGPAQPVPQPAPGEDTGQRAKEQLEVFMTARRSIFPCEEALRRAADYIEEELPPVSVVATVDHASLAGEFGLELRSTMLLTFGNPTLGTALMQSNAEIGKDLPLKLVCWETADGETEVAYNDPAYLARRYAIDDRDEQFAQMRGALSAISEFAAGPQPQREVLAPVTPPGLLRKTSSFSVAETIERAREQAGGDTFVVDHAAAAAGVGLELLPTTVLFISNFESIILGTDVMQAVQRAGVDFPLMVLASEDEAGVVTITTDDLEVQLAQRQGAEGQDAEFAIRSLKNVLDRLTDHAAGRLTPGRR
jgi:uncharacterized protein (DUF302 family)